MDLSDGLSLDLHRLCTASRVSADLDFVPARAGMSIEKALHGGEDYELLWTMPPEKQPPRGAIRIGRIVKGHPATIRLNGALVPAKGYDHFRSES
jgi:thiamine-monophosphate kinase